MADPSPAPPPTEPTPLDALAARLSLPAGWGGRLTHGIILLGVSVAAAFLVSPSLYSQQIPELTADQIGQPFRSVSPSGFKAGRDYEIQDAAKTEELREQARAAVRPVFDYDSNVELTLRKTLQAGFGALQDVVQQFHDEKSGAPANSGAPKTTEDALLQPPPQSKKKID